MRTVTETARCPRHLWVEMHRTFKVPDEMTAVETIFFKDKPEFFCKECRKEEEKDASNTLC